MAEQTKPTKPIIPKEQSEDKSSLSNVKQETNKIEKQEDVKEKDKKKRKSKLIGPKKTQAVVNGQNLPISTKHAVAICNYIRGKDIDEAISMLEQVEQMKKPIPMKGEIPHRKGKIMSGRYPINASKEFIKLLKSLKANAVINELELEKYVLFCVPNVAARPHRRFGRTRFKRTHVILKLIQPIKKTKININEKTKLIISQNNNGGEEVAKATEISSDKPIIDNKKII